MKNYKEISKEELLSLAKTTKVNKTFMKKLEKAGFEIWFTKYCYWNSVPCVQFEDEEIFLMEEIINHKQHSSNLCYRSQLDVIEEIIDKLVDLYE